MSTLVYKAIANVMSDLSKVGIGKNQTNTFDKYKFRGIDDMYAALSPLLSKHGLLMLPRVLARECKEHNSAGGKVMFYVTLDVEYDFVSAEDGSKHTVKVYGEAMDRGDKATNKAMSAAYKYCAIQAFSIPIEGDEDADNSSPEIDNRKPKGKTAGQILLDSLIAANIDESWLITEASNAGWSGATFESIANDAEWSKWAYELIQEKK